MSEDYYSHRHSSGRGMIGTVDDSGDVQTVDIEMLKGESFTKVMRIQPHGFSSVPIKDSHGHVISPGGSRDRLYYHGGEHPDKRPRKLGDGNSALYNADGTIWKMVNKDATLDAKGTETHTVKAVVFKVEGGVTVTIDKNGVTVQGGKISHNGSDVGSDHKHTGVMPGTGTTGTPA